MKRDRASLFLLELILSIFIFLCCAGVCISLFWTSHRLSQRSGELTGATYQAQSIAELWKKEGLAGLEALGAYRQGDDAILYYNSAWEPCGAEEARFVLCVYSSREGSLSRALVQVRLPDEAAFYELETASFGEVAQ